MELEEIFKIWDRFDKSSLTEMSLEKDGFHLTLKSADPSGLNSVGNHLLNDGRAGVAKDEAMPGDKLTGPKKEDRITPVKAALVGTFYRAPSPEAQAFVRIGQRVKKGEVIGIIEAMKLMNEVLSPVDGIVEEILVEENSLVQYDQILMRISQEA